MELYDISRSKYYATAIMFSDLVRKKSHRIACMKDSYDIPNVWNKENPYSHYIWQLYEAKMESLLWPGCSININRTYGNLEFIIFNHNEPIAVIYIQPVCHSENAKLLCQYDSDKLKIMRILDNVQAIGKILSEAWNFIPEIEDNVLMSYDKNNLVDKFEYKAKLVI